MWIDRDFSNFIQKIKALPIKVLKGPRQVGKTSLLEKLAGYEVIYFDDMNLRQRASENPKLFLDQFDKPIILDEASLCPEIFFELKRRVDSYRRSPDQNKKVDVWITGSNQTLLQKNVQESLAGRASYFDLNTLSIHEIPNWSLSLSLMKGGWPELYINKGITSVQYLNDLIHTFLEKDIVAAAGIEKKEAFSRALGLISGRIGQLINFSDIAKNIGVESTTVQSWANILEQNGILFRLQSYSHNLNQRLIKTPKIYFEDVGLATRMQGWSEYLPLSNSPQFGHLVENLAISEVSKFFTNRGIRPILYYVRTKEKVEIDLLIELPNQRYVAAEIKSNAQSWSQEQHKLIDSLKINIIEKWIISPNHNLSDGQVKSIEFTKIWQELDRLF